MKRILAACFFASLIAVSCSKSSNDVTPLAETYMTLTSGSVWNYDQKDLEAGAVITPYILTSTNRDSTISGGSYHVFLNSKGNTTEYYNISSDNEYRIYQNFPTLQGISSSPILIFYLDTDFPAGTTWSQNFNIVFNGLPQTLVRDNSILEKGGSRIVNGTTYNNVICVKSIYSIPALPSSILTSSIKTYYAPKYGMIEDSTRITVTTPLIFSTINTNTILKSAVLQ